MSRRSRLGTAGLLRRHLGAGAGASLLVAVLITASVLAVALAPHALARLGTAELRHELSSQSPAVLDLTGTGQLGIPTGLPAGSPVEELIGQSDSAIRGLRENLPEPLRSHVGPVQWLALTKKDEGVLPVQLPLKLSLSLAADLDWLERITFVEGAAPPAWQGSEVNYGPPVEQPGIPVAISADAAEKLQLRVGDQIGFAPADLIVTGVYEPRDPDDAYWVHEENLGKVTFTREQGDLPKANVIAYVDPGSMVGLPTTFQIGKLSAYLEMNPSAFEYAEMLEIQTQVRQLQAGRTELPLFGTLNFRSGLPNVLDRVAGRVTAASALLALSVSGLLGVLLAVFALGVQTIIARRRPALALAAARGAGALQLRSAMVLEGVLLAAPGAGAALALAAVLLPGDPGPAGWILPVLVAAAPPVLFGMMTSPRRLREPRGDLQVRGRTRLRWIAEVGVLGLAALSLLLLARRGLVASSSAVGIDPLLAATPLLLACAVCVGVLRLYPVPLLVLQRALRRRRGSAGVLGAARAVRDPALGFAAALALVVGISVVVFSTVMATTTRAGLVRAAQDTVGADVQIRAQLVDEDLLAQIAGVDGVRASVAVGSDATVDAGVDTNTTQVQVVVTDTAAMHEIRPDLPDLSQRAGDLIPVLVSSDWAQRVTGAQLTIAGRELQQAGVIRSDALPGSTRHFVYLDSAFSPELGLSAAPERVFLRLAPGARPADVARALDELVTATQPEEFQGVVAVTTADEILRVERASPTVASLETALLVAAGASLLLTMLTVVLASVAAATARNRLIGVLRILGMSPRQLRAVQAWELGPVAVTAIVVGTLLGLALPWIVTSALDLRPFVGGQTQPGPAIDPLWVLAAVGAFAVVVLLAGVVAGALGRRFAPAGTLKMGEA